MKLKCQEPGCGTTIQTGDDSQERVKSLMEKHVREQHGSLEQKHAKTLTKCLAVLHRVIAGETIKKSEAREVALEVSDLLNIPRGLRHRTGTEPAPAPAPEAK